ncbi:MAG: tetratricopeptide repeat protein [Alphaproteobacteria bacterium]|nr:tetratricopeptide repeat protein [Alphaproteobacteria bacterium]
MPGADPTPIRRFARYFFLVLLVCLASAPANLAKAAQVRAAKHADYARIVFDQDEAAAFTAQVEGGKLVVRFDQPFAGDLRSVVSALDGIVTEASLGPGRKSVILTLSGKVEIKSFSLGTSAVVDLIPAKGSQQAKVFAPKPPSAAPASSPRSGDTIPIRVGDHDDFSRLVFDWASPVAYDVAKQGEVVTVTFKRPARFEDGPLKANLPLFISGVETESAASTSTVTLFAPQNARIRHFTSGPKVVVDIISSADTKAGAASLPRPAPPTTAARPAPLSDRGIPTDLAGLSKQAATPPPAPATATATPPPAATPSPVPTPAPAPDAAIPPAPSAPPPASAPPAATPPTNAEAAPMQPSDLPFPAQTDEEDDLWPAETGPSTTASLSFTWNQPAAAAVFRRSGYLWIVFDRYQEVDLRLLKQLGAGVVTSVEQLPSKSVTIVRIVTQPGYNPSIRRENLLWIMDLSRRPLKPINQIEVKLEEQSVVGARALLKVNEAGSVIPLVDAEIGDQLFVIPVMPLGAGVQPGRDLPDMTLLATAQGIAVVKKTDGVDVRSTRDGAEISRQPGGIRFTKDADRLARASGVPTGPADLTAMTVAKWMLGDPAKSDETMRDLLQTVGQTSPEGRTQPRLTLARFLIANGLGAEALGVLRTIAVTDAAFAETAPFKAARGAANVLAHRSIEALEDLQSPALQGAPEARFWRALAEADQANNPGHYNDALKEGGGFLANYSPALQLRLGLLAALGAVSAADDLTAGRLMDMLKPLVQTETEKARLTFIEGRFEEMTGAAETALVKYREAEGSSGRWERSRAGIARVELELKENKITPAQAIQDLERLRFAWRGDDFEYNLLKRLAELYFKEKDFGSGLRTLKQLAANFRETKDIESIAAQMSDVFSKLFFDGEADKLPPFTAIALFEEFKELTPVGPKGDEMIRKLADRLAAIDLLDRASDLLRQQVRFRLQGEEKARVGFRNGILLMLNRNPQGAIDALAESEVPAISADLEQKRRYLKARSLAELNRVEEAIALIGEDTNRDALLLKVEIYWDKQNWPEVVNSFEALVPKPEQSPAKGGKLSDQEARFILNKAVALILAHDDRGLARIRRHFQPYMDVTPYKDAFTLLTYEPGTEGISTEMVAAKIKEVENFQTFMSGYRERLREEKLSAIN